MGARGYGEPTGEEYGADSDRERWRDRDRPGDYRMREGDEDRGFIERAGDEIRSWFGGSDEDERRFGREHRRGYERDEERGFGRSGWDRDRDRERRERSYGQPGRGGADYLNESRSSFGGMAQSGYGGSSGGFERESERGYGPSRGGAYRREGRQERGRERHAQSWGEANRGMSPGFGDYGGTLGGFGNQRFGSSQDELYRSWRDKQLQQLDRDYEEYCRECEQKFHQDFDSWRRDRQNQGQSGQGTSGELVPGDQTETAGPTGGSGTTGSTGGETTGTSTTADTTGSTETAGTGSSGGRSRSRS